MRGNLALRLAGFVLIAPIVATLFVCAVAFGVLYLLGHRYSLEQVQTAATVQFLFWLVVLATWGIRVWRRRANVRNGSEAELPKRCAG